MSTVMFGASGVGVAAVLHMTPEDFIAAAQKDPAGFAISILRDPGQIEKLAQLRYEDPPAYQWLIAEIRAAKIENLGGLKTAITAVFRQLSGPRPAGPVSMEEQLADYKARVNGQAGALDLGLILEDVLAVLRRYMWFPIEEQGWACCLWAAHTYCLPSANTSPRLHVKAPDPECGKTRLLELLVELVFSGKHYIKPSSAVIYRLLNKQTYTFLLDEIDGIYGREARGDEDLRMIIDAGQRRGGTVPRCVGDAANMDVVDFPVFSAMALAGIGRLPRTIESRSIPIALQKKTDEEEVESLFFEDIVEECEMLRLRLGAWADDNLAVLRGQRPQRLSRLGDRANEGWFPLRAIANAAGGEWPTRAIQAAELLSRQKAGKDKGFNSSDLLRDVRDIYDENPSIDGRLLTEFLLRELNRMEEAPWSLLNKGTGLGSHRLAGMLRDYGIESQPFLTEGRKTRRGYERSQFEEAWARYLTESEQ